MDFANPFWSEPIVHAYEFTIRPGRIKGWGMHRRQADRYFIQQGDLRVVLFDGREISGTKGSFCEFFFTGGAMGSSTFLRASGTRPRTGGRSSGGSATSGRRASTRRTPTNPASIRTPARFPSTGRFATAEAPDLRACARRFLRGARERENGKAKQGQTGRSASRRAR
ncbi:MAG: hypothetical protein ACRD16_10775 [Thermoanaerobaculia bacterium]